MDRERQRIWRSIERAGVVRSNTHIVLGSDSTPQSKRWHTRTHANFAPAKVPYGLREDILDLLEADVPHVPQQEKQDWFIVGTGCGNWYAAILARRLYAESVYADRLPDGRFIFRRDQAACLRGKKVVILDDVLCTGTTAVQLGELIVQSGGIIEGALFILDRGLTPTPHLTFSSQLVLSSRSIFQVPMEMWRREDCPECAQGVDYKLDFGAGTDEHHRYGQPPRKL